MIDQRTDLRSSHSYLRDILLRPDSVNGAERLSRVKDIQDSAVKFWQKYETAYAANQRPFLITTLAQSQESHLVEEEAKVVREIRRSIDKYFAEILAYGDLQNPSKNSLDAHVLFLKKVEGDLLSILGFIDELSDIRFIYSQRVVFAVSGENERQQGFFTSVFIGLLAAIIIISTLEYFFIHRPFSDIMAFLRDMSQGKRGQRLYFSSPIREIKESEDIINTFVAKAEEHEKER